MVPSQPVPSLALRLYCSAVRISLRRRRMFELRAGESEGRLISLPLESFCLQVAEPAQVVLQVRRARFPMDLCVTRNPRSSSTTFLPCRCD